MICHVDAYESCEIILFFFIPKPLPMIGTNYRPSNEEIFDKAMKEKRYPLLAWRVSVNPEQREKILKFNWNDDIEATMLSLEMDIEHDMNM